MAPGLTECAAGFSNVVSGWATSARRRITTATQAVLDGDAFARRIIARYADYVYAQPEHRLERSLEDALERYP